MSETISPLTDPRPLSVATVPGAILWGGLVAGALDLALILLAARGGSLITTGQGIAGAVIGPTAAANGGVATGLFGILVHFVVAWIMAAPFVLAATRLPVLLKPASLWGLIYGFGLWFVAHRIIWPLTLSPPPAAITHPPTMYFAIGAHMVLVGLPIALFAKRALTGRYLP